MDENERITYASGKSADLLIWVVRRAREEHRSVIEWLNNHMGCGSRMP